MCSYTCQCLLKQEPEVTSSWDWRRIIQESQSLLDTMLQTSLEIPLSHISNWIWHSNSSLYTSCLKKLSYEKEQC